MTIAERPALLPFTIASGASASGILDLRGASVRRLLLPATLQGTHLIFKHAAREGGTMLSAYDAAGTLIAIPFTQGTAVELGEGFCNGAYQFQLVTASSSSGTAQTQSADRVIQAVVV